MSTTEYTRQLATIVSVLSVDPVAETCVMTRIGVQDPDGGSSTTRIDWHFCPACFEKMVTSVLTAPPTVTEHIV